MRKLFHDCRLVHADLSEYNILYHAKALYIIDVSQSVEHDHPHAFEFLRKDLGNVEEFFSRRGVTCLGLRRAFDFVTRDRASLISDDIGGPVSAERGSLANHSDAEKGILELWLVETAAATTPTEANDGIGTFMDGGSEDAADTTITHAHEDAVFMNSYIPRNLNEVVDPERDLDVVGRGESARLIYANTIGLVQPAVASAGATKADPPKGSDIINTESASKPSARFVDETEGLRAPTISGTSEAGAGNEVDGGPGVDGVDDSDDSGSDASSETDEDASGDKPARPPRGHRHEDRDAKRERKRSTKEEAREKRKTKMKKADKKKKIKATRHS